jgi:hypothetical protein
LVLMRLSWDLMFATKEPQMLLERSGDVADLLGPCDGREYQARRVLPKPSYADVGRGARRGRARPHIVRLSGRSTHVLPEGKESVKSDIQGFPQWITQR